MFAVATAALSDARERLSGTPYIPGGTSAAGTDCSGLVSFVTNAATGRPVYGRPVQYRQYRKRPQGAGVRLRSKPGALNVGWNGGHTAATLPDGTPVSSGEGGGVKVGGGGAYQKQFSKHMYLDWPRGRAASTGGAAAARRVAATAGAPLPPEGVVVPVGFEAPLPPPPGAAAASTARR